MKRGRGGYGGKCREMWGKVEGRRGREGHGIRKPQIAPHFSTDTLDFDQKNLSFIKSRSERKGKKKKQKPPGWLSSNPSKTPDGKDRKKRKAEFQWREKGGRKQRKNGMEY